MTHHDKHAPALPQEILDEAGETPGWVPALGIGLLVLVTMTVALRVAGGDSAAPRLAVPAAEAAPAAPPQP
jgi:hypothetical protein